VLHAIILDPSPPNLKSILNHVGSPTQQRKVPNVSLLIVKVISAISFPQNDLTCFYINFILEQVTFKMQRLLDGSLRMNAAQQMAF